MPLGMRVARLLASPLAAEDGLFTFYSRERSCPRPPGRDGSSPTVAPLSAAARARDASRSPVGQFPIVWVEAEG